MDAIYLLKNSPNDNFEIQYSLRSLATFVPYIRKVWIFGDKPTFLSEDSSLIEHVPHGAVVGPFGFKVPVCNIFLLTYLASLIPGVEDDFLWFCDDFYLLKPLPHEEAIKDRYFEDMTKIQKRARGAWIDSVWRTYDVMTRLGYSCFNFENHVPTYMKKKWVQEAYRDLKIFVTQERFTGICGQSGILNHSLRSEKRPIYDLKAENSRCGYYGKPPTYEQILAEAEGKQFFSFDDPAFGPAIRRFLEERFPEKSKYEK